RVLSSAPFSATRQRPRTSVQRRQRRWRKPRLIPAILAVETLAGGACTPDPSRQRPALAPIDTRHLRSSDDYPLAARVGGASGDAARAPSAAPRSASSARARMSEPPHPAEAKP